jgi:hypothetical protein
MAEGSPPVLTLDEARAEPATTTVDPKQQALLAHAIEGKVAEGYRIESRTDLQALLVKDPSRPLGMLRFGRERRELLSVNEWGNLKVEQL